MFRNVRCISRKLAWWWASITQMAFWLQACILLCMIRSAHRPQFTDVYKISTKKNKQMEINLTQLAQSLSYLGSIMGEKAGADDVLSQINKSRAVFVSLKSLWRSRASISLKTKVRLYNSNVKTVLLCDPEYWEITLKLILYERNASWFCCRSFF